jgi:PAS domain S-box-containing protein
VFDITDHKTMQTELSISRAKLQEAGRLARLGHWEADLTTGELWWCDITYDLFGYDPAEFSPTLEEFWKHVHPEDMAKVKASQDFARQAGRADIEPIEHRILRSDGSELWVNCKARLRFDADGRAVQVFGAVQDITERKALEQAILDAKAAADRANQHKSDFILGMSHELRTPLNAIIGFGQLLEHDGDLNAEQQSNVEEIRKAGNHLLALIDEILDLSKVEAGRVELAMSTIDCRELAEECLGLVSLMAQKRDIRMELDVEPGIPLVCDATRLRQVIINLLSNGVKYNRPHGVVRVQAHRSHDSESRSVHIDVEDTGFGIPQDKIDRLFRPFERLGRQDVQGTGIGLVLSKRLVEAMGGTLSVASSSGQGTCFRIALPVTRMPGVSQQRQRKTVSDLSQASGLVLHIDDNPSNLKLLQSVVLRLGQLDFMGAPTPSLGIDLAVAYKPRLIFLDLNLPGMSGLEVLKRLRSMPSTRQIPVVGLTVRASPEEMREGLQCGFDRYLTMPFDFDEVVATIGEFTCDVTTHGPMD